MAPESFGPQEAVVTYASRSSAPLQEKGADLLRGRQDILQAPDADQAFAHEKLSMRRSLELAGEVRDDVKNKYPDADRFTPEDLLKGMLLLKMGKPVSPELHASLQANGFGSMPREKCEEVIINKLIAEQDCAQSLQVAWQVDQLMKNGGVGLSGVLSIIRTNGLKDMPALMRGIVKRDLREYLTHRRDDMRVHSQRRIAQNAYTGAGLLAVQAQEYFRGLNKLSLPNQKGTPPKCSSSITHTTQYADYRAQLRPGRSHN